MDQMKRMSAALTFIGLLSMMNGLIANCIDAEKSYHTKFYMNTHWITSITLFAGISALLCQNHAVMTTIFMFAILCNFIALLISSVAIVADFLNIVLVINNLNTLRANPSLTSTKIYGMIFYNAADLLLSGVAIVLMKPILLSAFCHFVGYRVIVRSKLVASNGICILFISFLKSILWLLELHAVASRKASMTLSFISYTIEEPFWIIFNAAIGVVYIFSSNKGIIPRLFADCMSTVSLYPTIIILWIDYKWFSSTLSMTFDNLFGFHKWLLFVNIVINCAHILLLIWSLTCLVVTISNLNEFKLSDRARSILRASGLTAAVVSVLLLIIDVVAAKIAAFFKLFQGSEQKTPFILMIVAILIIIATTSNRSASIIPAAIVFLLFCLQSTTFNIISYIYLTSNNYFSSNLCDLFTDGSTNCTLSVMKTEKFGYFLETFLYLSVFTGSVILLHILWQIMQANKSQSQISSDFHKQSICNYQKIVEVIGMILLVCGIITLQLSVRNFVNNNLRHPILVILSSLYHLSVGLSLLIFPLYQIIVSRTLGENQLSRISLILMATFRFFEVLTQLDYRNIGEPASFNWKIHTAVDIISLGTNFATIVLCLKIIDISAQAIATLEVTTIFRGCRIEFNNRRDSDGYMELLSE